MADAPFGRGPNAAPTVQEPKLQLADFSEAVGRSRVDQLVFMAVRSARLAVSSPSNVVWSLIGCPSPRRGWTMLSPAAKFHSAKPGRSEAQRYERQEAPIAPRIAWPAVCNPASPPDASQYNSCPTEGKPPQIRFSSDRGCCFARPFARSAGLSHRTRFTLRTLLPCRSAPDHPPRQPTGSSPGCRP